MRAFYALVGAVVLALSINFFLKSRLETPSDLRQPASLPSEAGQLNGVQEDAMSDDAPFIVSEGKVNAAPSTAPGLNATTLATVNRSSSSSKDPEEDSDDAPFVPDPKTPDGSSIPSQSGKMQSGPTMIEDDDEDEMEGFPAPYQFHNSELAQMNLGRVMNSKHYPGRIDYYGDRESESIYPTQNEMKTDQAKPTGSSTQVSSGIMTMMSPEYSKTVARERSEDAKVPRSISSGAGARLPSAPQSDAPTSLGGHGQVSGTTIQQTSGEAISTEASAPSMVSIPENNYEFVSIALGRNDNKQPIKQEKNIRKAILGPDFDFTGGPDIKEQDLTQVKSRVVSLGHGGSIVLKVSGEGIILDKEGPDFTVYENVFKDASTGLLFNEFAMVGVSLTGASDSYVWFPCNPKKKEIKYCAGVVPTSDGGDQFDLASIGVNQAKFIQIKDTGTNYHPSIESSPDSGTEGFDLDAIAIIHGFKPLTY